MSHAIFESFLHRADFHFKISCGSNLTRCPAFLFAKSGNTN